MGNSAFNRWTDAVQHLNEKIKDNQLIAGNNIQLERTGYGVRVNCTAKNSQSDTYGYFKVINASADGEIKFQVLDGLIYTAGGETDEAGYIFVNDDYVRALNAEFTIESYGTYLIYLECSLGETINTAELKFKEGWELSYVSGKAFIPVSRIGYWTRGLFFSQEHIPPQVLIMGRCIDE